YAGTHGTFPYAAPDSSAPYAGTFGVLLNDSGYLRHAAVLNCPCDKRDRVPDRLPDFRTLCLDESRAPKSSPCLRNVDYAYNLGYRQDGRPVPISIAAPISTPLLADRPPCTKNHCKVLDGNSPNHGGLGQNVLYTGGHVRWHPTRRLGPHDDDMFLNAEHHLAPGLHEQDAVLGPGFARFDAR
ncbi:MAG: hypothetical protein IRY99_19625, partial [Isosphaeraceae bacterium]|nr:hypothetical protein [Isosphaeraceae bacterium]